VTSRIALQSPPTITAFAGDPALSSLGDQPPGGIFVTDPNPGGIVTVQLTTANAGASLAAGSAGGATISSNANTLTITGTAAEVNAALATLQINEAAGATSDTIYLTASDPSVLPASTAIAVNVVQAVGPAFVAPPAVVTLTPNQLDPLRGLLIGDPQATGLAQAGLGREETLALTLAASSGILVLPGYSALDGISAYGLGTGTIVLDFTANELGEVNTLLAGLEFAGPAATSGLAYSVRNVSGPLPTTVTSGNIVLDITGPPGATGTFAAGPETVILGEASAAAGSTLAITTTTGDLGGLTGDGAVDIAADAALNLPYNALSLGGTSLDFGTLSATTLFEAGALLIAESATFASAITLGPSALLDFAGNLIADNAAQVVNELAISLEAGAVLTGDGVITAGNFSESGRINGPGTILAEAGETLLIAAGSIGGGTHLDVAAGGIMVLGPVSPLYGIFDATPLTIDSSVTLAFTGAPGVEPVTGGYADFYDQSGGAFVINGPQAFSGTIVGFEPGDRLIFPGLTGLNIFNVNTLAGTFDIAGINSTGTTVTYVIFASYPTGTSLYTTTDSEGDAEIGLRPTAVQFFVDGVPLTEANLNATAGVAQPLQGLSALLVTASTFTLTLTLSVGHGILSDGTLASGPVLTLTAANPTALNLDLAGLTYTGTGQIAILTISSSTGILAGVDQTIRIGAVAAGTISGFGGPTPTEAQTVDFTAASTTPQTQAAAVGQVIVAANQVFADALLLNGIGGTALLIDGGATGWFDPGASVVTQADVTIGNALGAGTFGVITDQFTIGGNGAAANLTIGGAGAAAGNTADIFGTLGVDGTVYAGQGAASALDLAGNFGAIATSLGSAGTLFAYGGAAASLGNLSIAGTALLQDQVTASAGTLALSGALSLGGTAILEVAGGATMTGAAALTISPDATFSAGSFGVAGGKLTDSGILDLGSLTTGGGLISLTGGTLATGGLTLGPGSTLNGFGLISATGTILNQGLLAAANGTLILDANLSNAGTIHIGGAATLETVLAISGGAIDFTGTSGELIIDDNSGFNIVVNGMTAHDGIDLVGVAPSLVSLQNGRISWRDTLGNTIGGFSLGVIGGQPAVSIVSDNAGGALITLGDEIPCFARGTRLLTPNGYRPIESLSPGDALITQGGDRRPLRWIGHRTLDLFGRNARAGAPVLIMPHAFGPNRPLRALRLSPLHAVFIDGVLVPSIHLVNGATIRREAGRAAVTYYHLELDRHDAVLAEGLACETYLCTGNRGGLYHEAGRRTPATRPLARRVTTGPALAAIRRRLHDIALAAGFTLTYHPVLRAVANDITTMPDMTMVAGRRIARFALPAATSQLTLLSTTACPADTDPDSEDRRDLALCLRKARAGRAPARLGRGWLPRGSGDAGDWMGGSAELLLPPATDELTLSFAAVIRSWRPPATAMPAL
jgi:hypothetical protein